MGVTVKVDAGTVYTFETGEYWAEEGGKLLVYGAHASGGTRVLERFDTWIDVYFTEA
jgi:hypothetical protein